MDGDLEEDDVRPLSPLLPRLRTDATVSPSVGPGVLNYSPGLFWCVSKGCVEWVLMSLSCTPCVLSLADRTGVLCNCDALFTLLTPSSSPLRVVSRPRRGDPRTRPTRSIPDPPLPPTHFRSSLRSQSSLMPRFTTWRSKAKRRRGFPFVPCRRPNEASLTCPPSARGRAPGQRAPYNLCCASSLILSIPSSTMHATIILALISLLPLASSAPHSRGQRDFHHRGNLPILPAMPSSPAVTGNATRVFDAEDQGPTHVVSNPKVVPNPRFSKVTSSSSSSSSKTTIKPKSKDVSVNVNRNPAPTDPPPRPTSPGYVDCTANGGHCLVPGPTLGSTSSGKNLDVVHTGAATCTSSSPPPCLQNTDF